MCPTAACWSWMSGASDAERAIHVPIVREPVPLFVFFPLRKRSKCLSIFCFVLFVFP
jgi:hypothetical protein